MLHSLRRLVGRSNVAALDPADEAADVDAAGKQALVVSDAQLRRFLILRPLVKQTLQARNVEHAAGQWRSFDALEVAADGFALGIEYAKPGCLGHAAAALV